MPLTRTPKKATKFTSTKDMVVLPRREYEALLREAKKYAQFKEDLDHDLDEAIAEHRSGKSVGPFRTVDELRASLAE